MSVEIALAIVLHLLLLGSMAAFLIASIAAVRDTRSRLERLLRAGMAFAGALVVLGSQAAGLTFSDFIVRALSGSTFMAQGVTVVAVAVPSVLGVAVGMYFLRAMKRDKDRALRVLAFVGTLASVQFAQIYAIAVDQRGVILGATAVPNISFVVAILIYAALRYETAPSGRREPSRIAALAEKFSPRGAVPAKPWGAPVAAGGLDAPTDTRGFPVPPATGRHTAAGPDDDGLLDLRHVGR